MNFFLLACLLGCALAPSAARADDIGINFEGGFFPTPLGASQVAGVVPQEFWNNVSGGFASAMPLSGDNGGSSAVNYNGFTLSVNSSGSDTTAITNTDGSGLLMVGYAIGESTAGAGTVGITVSNVPSQLTGAGYAVIAYFDLNNGGAYAVDQFTLSANQYGTQTIYGQDKANTDFSGVFKQVPSSSTSDLGASTPDGNYVVFSGLTDTNFTLLVTGGSNGGLNSSYAFINGLQLVPDSALPATGAPLITSASTATGAVQVAFSYLITANNNATGFGASSLPPGLSVNTASGLISGTPTVPGAYNVTLGATNADGVGTLALTLSVGAGVSPSPAQTGTTNTLLDGTLVNVNDGWASGGDGTLLTTTNGGQTWGMINVGLTNDLLAVHGIGGYVFIGGTGGLLGMSPDGGQTWTYFNLNLTNAFESFSFLTPFWGYAVGSGGVIDFWNGSQWLDQTTGTAADLHGVDAIDATNAFAVGDSGTVLEFDGATWNLQDSGAGAVNFYGVSFLNDSFGYAVGSGGAIYQTTDGGVTWSALNSGTTATLRSVTIADTNTAWAVGDGGVFLQTTDGGAHWTQVSLGTTVNLDSIQFLNGFGMICGDDGTAYVFWQAGYAVNQSPVVSILAPTDGAVFPVCSKTPIVADAYDPDGYVTDLQLFLDSTQIADTATPPLSYVWTNDTLVGTFTCVAKATDNSGATTFSTPVTLTVFVPTNELVALGTVPADSFEFCVCGQPNGAYGVETTSNLLSGWTPWQVVTNSAEGFVPVVEGGVSTHAQKFYRAALATDLAVASSSLSTNQVSSGGILTVSVTVTNGACSGTSAEAGPFHVGLYWAGSEAGLTNTPAVFEVPVTGCGANATAAVSQTVTIGSNIAPGTYYLGFRINDENEVPECDTANDGIFYWPVTVQ